MIEPPGESDYSEIAALYRRNHPDDGGDLSAEIHHESQMFVARDDQSRIVGVALVSYINCGVAPYGIIQQLEVSRGVLGDKPADVRRRLVDACIGWLAGCDVELIYGRTVDKVSQFLAMYRYDTEHEDHWVLDPPPSRPSCDPPSLPLPRQIYC